MAREWATNAENIKHAFNVGLNKARQGENNKCAKLTNTQARFIRDNPNGLTISKLAEMFGVNPTTISNIQRGKKYKGVGGVARDKAQCGLPKVSNDVRESVRAEYKSSGCSSRALAKKYSIAQSTVIKILKEGD